MTSAIAAQAISKITASHDSCGLVICEFDGWLVAVIQLVSCTGRSRCAID